MTKTEASKSAAPRFWTKQEWQFIVDDAKCARDSLPMLRRMGARGVRRWAKVAIAAATGSAQ